MSINQKARAKRYWVDSLPFPKFRACVAHEENDELQWLKNAAFHLRACPIAGPLFLAIGVFDECILVSSCDFHPTSHAQSGGNAGCYNVRQIRLKVLRRHDAPHRLTATPQQKSRDSAIWVRALLVINSIGNRRTFRRVLSSNWPADRSR